MKEKLQYILKTIREERMMKEKKDYIRTLDRLYKCRDLEITNLWQRSIFLSVFLTLCFTGYGVILMKIVEKCDVQYYLQLSYLHLVSTLLAFVGSVFSLVWIFMAKSSKAWYEVYERAISTFEYENYDKIGLSDVNIMGEMGLPSDYLDNRIFSTKAGAYSPSKLNILIGQICLVVWLVISISHSIFCWCCICSTLKNDISVTSKLGFILISLIPLILLLIITYILQKKKNKISKYKSLNLGFIPKSKYYDYIYETFLKSGFLVNFMKETYSLSETIDFGKYRGKTLEELFNTQPRYLFFLISKVNIKIKEWDDKEHQKFCKEQLDSFPRLRCLMKD